MKPKGIGLAAALGFALLPAVATVRSPAVGAAVGAPTAWSTTVNVSPAGVDASGSQLVVDAAGNATAVWLGPDGVTAARLERRASAWSAPVTLGPAGSFGGSMQVGVDAAGDVVAAWDRGGLSGGHLVRAAWFHPTTGAWDAPLDVSDVDATVMFMAQPALAVDANGDAVMVWNRSDGTMWWATSTATSTSWTHSAN